MGTFSLAPRRIPAERKAATAKREVDQDTVAREESVSEIGSDADSGWSGVSENSTDSECTDMEASSIASDQDRFDTTYEAFQDLAIPPLKTLLPPKIQCPLLRQSSPYVKGRLGDTPYHRL